MLGTGAKQLPKMAEVLPFSIFLPLLCIAFLVVETEGTEPGEDMLKLSYFFPVCWEVEQERTKPSFRVK